MALLTQNSELKAIGVWNWTLPAWAGRLADGRTYNTCEQAGWCRKICYARQGTYRFPDVLAAHEENLRWVMDDLAGWKMAMTIELERQRYSGGFVRIHDSGDFWSDEYTRAWLDIARSAPKTIFYSYTKEVSRFRREVEGSAPPNFLWCYSYGGREDHLITVPGDRVADVFPDEVDMAGTGFVTQDADDRLAVLGPPLVGIVANNIPHFRRALAGHRLSWHQAAADAAAAARRARRSGGAG